MLVSVSRIIRCGCSSTCEHVQSGYSVDVPSTLYIKGGGWKEGGSTDYRVTE